MDTPPASTTSVSGRPRAHEAVSTLPRTAVTGAIFASASRISGAPISPAWRMRSDPRRASTDPGRSRPWASEITPRVTYFTVVSFDIVKLMCACGTDECVLPYVVLADSSQIVCRALTDFAKWSKAILPRRSKEDARSWSKPGGSAAALVGIPRVSPQAGECYPQSAGRARYLCGDADRRREIAVLPASGGDFREDGGGGFSVDCADAGPGGATGADGHSGGGHQ